MAWKVLLAVLTLGVGGIIALYLIAGPPAVQRTEALYTVMESDLERSLIYVPETAVASVLHEQRGRGFSCSLVGVRVNAGMSQGFYWLCTKTPQPEEEPPMADADQPRP